MSIDPGVASSEPPARGPGRRIALGPAAAPPAAVALATLCLIGLIDPAGLEPHAVVARPLGWSPRIVRWATAGASAAGLVALVPIGGAYGPLDRAVAASTAPTPPPVARIVGGVAAWPMRPGRGRGVRRLLVVVAAFAGWVAGVRQADWSPRKPFLRAHAQIRPGMTRGRVEAPTFGESRGRPPVSRWQADGGRSTLDPDDGRYDSESPVISTSGGRVVSTSDLPD